jgi:hypothetical protein
MSNSVAHMKHRLREQAEHHLRMASMDDLRVRYPAGTAPRYGERGALFWRYVFVPAYRRIPWPVKERAMRALRMTADTSGWTRPAREPSQPWRPPAPR